MRCARSFVRFSVLQAAGTLVWAASAQAQTLKPGLWEITQKTQLDGRDMGAQMAQMQSQLAKLPPEQRKLMEDMMAKQGMSMPGAAPGGGLAIKVCMTKEMVERNEIGRGGNPGDCTHAHQPRSGNTMKFSFICKNPPSTGEGQVTFSGPEAYNTKMVVNTQLNGQAHRADMDSHGKWLGADCGAVKPLMAPKI